jgi:hypothetical protein
VPLGRALARREIPRWTCMRTRALRAPLPNRSVGAANSPRSGRGTVRGGKLEYHMRTALFFWFPDEASAAPSTPTFRSTIHQDETLTSREPGLPVLRVLPCMLPTYTAYRIQSRPPRGRVDQCTSCTTHIPRNRSTELRTPKESPCQGTRRLEVSLSWYYAPLTTTDHALTRVSRRRPFLCATI